MIEIRRSLVASGLTLVGRFDGGDRTPNPQSEDRTKAQSGLEGLTTREREVVLRAVAGNANKAIAYDLGIADATVRVLLWRAYGKLGVRSRRDLVAKAFLLLQTGAQANAEPVQEHGGGELASDGG
jgi:DNA-binding NarL/FixJ family response regulator